MEISLVLPADEASRFLRLPLVAAARRNRPTTQHIVWHDSADAALAAQGLALEEERGVWRLQKLVPGPADLWPPGGAPPLLAQAPSPDQLGHDLPAPLVPVVASAGRRQAMALETADGEVSITLMRGLLRTVTAEHTFCRLNLAGEDRAILHVALGLAAALPVTIATSSLAGFALATARNVSLPVRHGTPELPAQLEVVHAFGFALGHLTDVLLQIAPAAALDNGNPEPVHQMRVTLRRLRSVLTIFQSVLDAEDLRVIQTDLKALNARLGPTRDWDVFLAETLPAVQAACRDDARLARLVNAAARRRRECHAALRAFLASQEFRRLGIMLAWLAGSQSSRSLPNAEQEQRLQEFAATVLERRSRKLAAIDDLAGLEPAQLHEIRLKAKRVRYAAEIFAPIFPGKTPRRFIHRLAVLQDLLGSLNDGVTAERLLAELGGSGGRHAYASGLVLGFLAAHSSDVRPELMRRWSKLRHADTFWD